jgi:integral membrane protein (TIGR01906 family)
VAVLGGALGLISVLILGGIVSFVAFDALFETFHQIFFAGGSYTFDPATERLVQLFPFQFWQETAIVVGAVCIVLAGVVVAIATVRVSAADARAAAQAPPEVADGTATSMSATGSSR